MNIIVDSQNKNLAEFIATRLSITFGIDAIAYDYDSADTYRSRHRHCIVVPGPDTTEKYRKLSSTGYTPDLVIVAATTDDVHIDRLNTFYEGRVSVFPHMKLDHLLGNITKAVSDEIIF